MCGHNYFLAATLLITQRDKELSNVVIGERMIYFTKKVMWQARQIIVSFYSSHDCRQFIM